MEGLKSSTPQKPSQIREQMEGIKKGIGEIHRMINQLNEQLFKILLPEIVEDKKDKVLPSLNVPMADELAGISATTWDAVHRLNYLIERIDI